MRSHKPAPRTCLGEKLAYSKLMAFFLAFDFIYTAGAFNNEMETIFIRGFIFYEARLIAILSAFRVNRVNRVNGRQFFLVVSRI